MLELKNLSIGYKANVLHKAIDLRLESSKVYGLIGLNGVGKSTFLRSVIGLQEILTGEVIFDGEKIGEISSEEMAKKVSVVLTHRPEIGHFSVEEIVKMGRAPYQGWRSKLDETSKNIVDRAIQEVGLEDIREKDVMELSDGQFQRVMIAKALAQDTPIMVLDEPSSFLDLNAKIQLYELLELLAKKHQKTILLSSHEIQLAEKHVDEFILMTKENIEQIPSNNLRSSENFRSIFKAYLNYL